MNEFWRATACPHDTYADDGPDVFGDRICAKCGTTVRVVLTDTTLKTTFNKLATDAGRPRPFQEID